MNIISNNHYCFGLHCRGAQEKKAEVPSSIVTVFQRKDFASISENWQQQVDWQAETQQVINNLQKSFPNVAVFYSQTMNKQELSGLASALGTGSHLILSSEFLLMMGSSQENFEKGKILILNALNDLSSQKGQAVGKGIYLGAQEKMSWSLKLTEKDQVPKTPWQKEAEEAKALLDRMKEMQKEMKERQEKQKELRKSLNASNYRTAGSYAQLASANTKSHVQWVMGDVRRKIAKLRMSCSAGDTEEQMKARSAIKSYEKLLTRGRRKIRRLNEEELVRLRKKQAERNQQQKEALRLKIEMNKQRTKRKSADHMIVEEGRLHDLNQAVYSPHRRSKYSHLSVEAASMASAVNASGSAVDLAAAATEAGGSFTSADVTITVESL